MPEHVSTRLDCEPVLLIHGTWANLASSSLHWWQPGSEFCFKLDEALKSKGSRASCWATTSFTLGDKPPVFAWTGANRESERRMGSEALADLIPWLEGQNRPYHIVAHSHGGNVVLG